MSDAFAINMLQPNIFNSIFVIPILNLLIGFYKVFTMIRLPGDFGFSIIALTVFVRVILHPFFKNQMETAKKMQDLKPHLDRIQDKHKKDPKKLQEEQMRLYQEAGINPASGCLFMIIQMPIFIGLYQTLSLFFSGNMAHTIAAINKVLYLPFLHIMTINPWFFGVNLAVTPQSANNPLYYIIPAITAVLQYFQAQASMPAPVPEPAVKEGGEKKADTAGDFQKAMNTQMKYIFPLMIGWFSLRMPVGLSLYWNIFSLFSIMQYRQIQKKAVPAK